MTYTITSKCISCQRCLSACPTSAIQTNGSAFWIEVDRCNQCEGAYGVPQCWAVCPTNEGCVPLTEGVAAVALTTRSEGSADYWESWSAKYVRMVGRLNNAPQSSYWQHWFEAYGQRLRNLQANYGPVPSGT